MKNERSIVRHKPPASSNVSGGVLCGSEVKTQLREQQGLTLKRWALENGYPYDAVSCVVRGINRGTYGMGHRIAVALGMKRT